MKKDVPVFSVDTKDPWSLTVYFRGRKKTLKVVPPAPRAVIDEKCDALPEFNPNPIFNTPYVFRALDAFDCAVPCALIPESVSIRSESGVEYIRGRDFDFSDAQSSAGRLKNGRIPENSPVFVSYQFRPSRIDAVVADPDGTPRILCGRAHTISPKTPPIPRGTVHLGNLYFSESNSSLTDDMLYPIKNKRFTKLESAGSAARLLPKTLAKLRGGTTLKILAWGDSVTAALYLKSEKQRWQTMFAEALRRKYGHSGIVLKTLGWGGRTTGDFLREPENSPYHYQKFVLGSDADLVVSEFVNDAGMKPEDFIPGYRRILADFRAAGKEWIILTPHWIRPSWMGLENAKDCSADPRPLVAFLRTFARENGIALADASAKYAELTSRGIPYMSFMTNGINHPDSRGMKLFCLALMELFPA